MKISPYRTCELCAHFRRGRGRRDYCGRRGGVKVTKAGSGCLRFEAKEAELEGLIRELEIRRWKVPALRRGEGWG